MATEPERGKRIAMELLDEYPGNPSEHTEADLVMLAASLQRFGQQRELIVRRIGKRYTVLAGHGVRKALLRINATHAICTIVPDSWSEVEAAGYLLADNHRADADDRRLLTLWEDQISAGQELASVGTTDDEVAAVRAMLGLDLGDEVKAPARPRAVTDEKQHQHVKLVLYMPQVELVEAAIRKTGKSNRGDAVALICRAFLDNDWIPPEGEPATVD